MTGLIYLNNRHHDPVLGTFISVDPLVTMTGEPYIYGSANPITYSDPTGLCSMISGDLWCSGSNFTRAEECVNDGSCSGAATRTGFTAIRHTPRGHAIASVIDVAYEGDWSKLDGNWSAKDIEYAAAGGPPLQLLGGSVDAAAVVANVAGSFEGRESEWEALDGERSRWWEHVAFSVGSCVGLCGDFTLSADGLDANLGGAVGLMTTGPSVTWSEHRIDSGGWPSRMTDVSASDHAVMTCAAIVIGGCYSHSEDGGLTVTVMPGFGIAHGQGIPRRTVELPWIWGDS